MLLEQFNSPKDLKKLSVKNLNILCKEIRKLIIKTTSENGGHLASNLGVVELTVALHKVFDTPVDEIVWDVGHQCYTHKILTGRYKVFSTLRKEGGISGFPKSVESVHDAFVSGHSGNSISAALGIAAAKSIKGEEGHAVAVIGDGSFSNGLACEGFNNAGKSGQKIIVVLNDNEMSISPNVGAISSYLSKIRNKPEYFQIKDATKQFLDGVPLVGRPVKEVITETKKTLKNSIYGSNFFEDFGYEYLGPVDGHDLESLDAVLTRAKHINKPVVVHVRTKKGKGYPPAEKNPSAFHGVGAFNIKDGKPKSSKKLTYSDVFGKKITELAMQDKTICAITAAMADGTGLESFKETFEPKGRFFDVGIAESHGVTFAAGLAKEGLKPVFAVYSTFLQRGFDQVFQDASLEKRKLLLAVDRAGIVGNDGETHQGLFDVALLSPIPNIKIYSPASYSELEAALDHAIKEEHGVVSVRYPRGTQPPELADVFDNTLNFMPFTDGQSDTLLIGYGRHFAELIKAKNELMEKHGRNVHLLKLTQIAPIDINALKLAKKYKKVYFYEEAILQGSAAQTFGSLLLADGHKGYYKAVGVENKFIDQLEYATVLKQLDMDSKSIVKTINIKNIAE